MKKYLIILSTIIAAACAQDPYRLKINNNMANEHGKSIYFRSNLRSSYAGQIRGVLSKKFGESGMKTATSAETADFIGIFDIETFYVQRDNYESATYFKSQNNELPLFSSAENDTAMAYSGNSDIIVNHDQTCFTLKIGRKDSSFILYSSSFCAGEIMETENIVPLAMDIYGKYGNYQSADVGVQCFDNINGKVSCDTVHDRQQAFINSLWIDKEISSD
ncbi:MAG: hypothetical protein IJ677_07500 [Alphaproteobacteria bacterium]|nr:hypothetical protein [Alphaproteobacteria bacterium]